MIIIIPIMFSFALCLHLVHTDDSFYRGLFVVPGLGRTDRLKTTIHNIKQLQYASLKFQTNLKENIRIPPSLNGSHWSGIISVSQISSTGKSARTIYWDCVIYIYASRLDSEFWSHESALTFLSKYCELVEHPNKRVTENMYMIQPALLRGTYEYVFLLLDDIKIMQPSDFQLHRMIELLHCNELTVLSPMVSQQDSMLLQVLISNYFRLLERIKEVDRSFAT